MSPPRKAYADTAVPVSKSQDELRRLLLRFGAQQFTMGEGQDWAGIEFVHADHLVRLRCPVRDQQAAIAADSRHVSAEEKRATAAERERARVWRVLVWSVKARLVAVEEGLETFEQAFLSHLVDPNTRRTVWQRLQEPIERGDLRIGGEGLPALGTGS